jgi:hypothetical protein
LLRSNIFSFVVVQDPLIRHTIDVCRFISFQAESVKHAAWGCDWVGTPVSFQRCLAFIIVAADKEFTLTAGKFVPVSNKTMMNV